MLVDDVKGYLTVPESSL